jgi:hypothetical protein
VAGQRQSGFTTPARSAVWAVRAPRIHLRRSVIDAGDSGDSGLEVRFNLICNLG